MIFAVKIQLQPIHFNSVIAKINSVSIAKAIDSNTVISTNQSENLVLQPSIPVHSWVNCPL